MELYKTVVNSLDGTEELLTSEHCSKISMADGEISEDVYLLILCHYYINNEESKNALINGKELPYSSKTITKDGRGLNFKVAQMPEDLQKIIVRFLRLVSV
jgi:hypothetical protein